MTEKTAFNIIQFPLDGVAAYWLSLARMVSENKEKSLTKIIEEELAYRGDPFIRHLLQLSLSELNEADFRKIVSIKMEIALQDLQKRLDLMRLALTDIASLENPGKSMIKIQAHFVNPPLSDEKAANLAQEMLKVAMGKKNLPSDIDKSTLFNVDITQKPDVFLVGLLFYVMFARREGKQACQQFMDSIHNNFFKIGLSLVIDGFDEPFIRKTLRVHRQRIVEETEQKMKMSLEICLALRNKKAYNYIFELAKAWLP